MPISEKLHSETDGRQDEKHTELLRKRTHIAHDHMLLPDIRQQEKIDPRIGSKAISAQQSQHKQQSGKQTECLGQGKEVQQHIGLKAKDRVQVIHHCMKSLRVDACHKQIIVAHGIDPVIVDRRVREMVSPVLQNDKAILIEQCKQKSYA